MTQSYYKCSFFEEELKNKKNFSVLQDEIKLENFFENGKASFKKETIEYICSYQEKIKFSGEKPIAIIPIKDNDALLKFTLSNLNNFNVFKYVDFIIVDDRSTTDIKAACSDFPVNYLRIDNKKGFNFSMLNNIAAKICNDYATENIILWNSDLWVADEQTIPKLLKLHEQNSSTISGTRLLYPPFSWNNKETSDNIMSHFPSKKDSYRDTIQFGGSMFSFNMQFKTYFPNHFCRFKEKDHYLVKVDKLEQFVTGAFHIINLKWFLQTGGLNPSMAKVFQDVDLCLKAVSEDKKVFYFGKENYLFHDESVSTNEKKIDEQFKSDHILYAKIWDYQKFTKEIQKFG
jgi:GT2 family glycosyltransferase